MKIAYLLNRPMNVSELTEFVDLNYELSANWRDKSNKLQERRWRQITSHTKYNHAHKHHNKHAMIRDVI